jgi:hypothetical protein
MKMNRVVKILMQRDDLSQAEELLREVRYMLEECNYDPEESEDIISSELGLESDYIMDILFD